MTLVLIPFLVCCTCFFKVMRNATSSARLQRGQLIEVKTLAGLFALIVTKLIIVARLLFAAFFTILFFLAVLSKLVTLGAATETQLLQALTAYMLVHQAFLTGLFAITSIEIVIQVTIADFIIFIIIIVIHIEVT